MADDIPKTTIVVLLVLTVVISIACTWVVLDNTMSTRVGYITEGNTESGQVRINIGPGEEQAPPITGEAVSNVRINII
ncbi:hypothetical protein KY361_05700 [Candidatus Woesearchaeota archaeon]|nr:hypothetical protein [Candidatus Woesearchaeota archaeon]